MANFLEVLNATTSALGGLAAILNQGAEKKRAEDLQMLQFLEKAGLASIEPVARENVRGAGLLPAIVGSPFAVSQAGYPTVQVGSGMYTARPAATGLTSESISSLLNQLRTGSPAAPSTTVPAPPPLTRGEMPALPAQVSQQPAFVPPVVVPPEASGQQQSMAVRMNNPLNIKYGTLTKKWVDSAMATLGEAATDGGRFLKFVSPEVGLQAAQELLSTPTYAQRTVDEALRLWSNSGYDGNIVAGKIDPTKTIASLNPDERMALLAAQMQQEGFPIGRLSQPASPPVTTGIAAAGTPSLTDVGQPAPPTAASTTAQDAAFRTQIQAQPPVTALAQAAPASAQATTQAVPGTPEATIPSSTMPPQAAAFQQRVAQTQGQPLITGPFGHDILPSLAQRMATRMELVWQTLPKNVKGRTEFLKQFREAEKELAQTTKDFLGLRNEVIKANPASREYLMSATDMRDLEARLRQTPGPEAVNAAAFLDILNAGAVAQQSNDWRPVAQAVSHWQGLGVDAKALEPALEASGYTGWRKGQEAATVARANIRPGVEKIEAESGPLAAAAQKRTAAEQKEQQRWFANIPSEFKRHVNAILDEKQLAIQGLTQEQRAEIQREAQKREVAYQGQLTTQRVKATVEQRKDEPLHQRAQFLFHPDLLKNASYTQSGREAEQEGYIYVPPKRQEKVMALHSANNYMEDMRTLLLGGVDRSGWITGKKGETFPGIMPDAQKQLGLLDKDGNMLPQGVVGRFLTGVNLKSAVVQGKPMSHWAEVYDRIRESFGPSITARGLEGEVGRVPNQREQQSLEIIAKSGLTSLLTTAPLAAKSEFDFLQTFIRDNTNLLLGLPENRGAEATSPPAQPPQPASTPAVPRSEGARRLLNKTLQLQPQ